MKLDEVAVVLKRIELENFAAFPKARLGFARHLNVIVGENGMGKTQLLKLPYAAMAMSAEESRRRRNGRPTRTVLRTRLAEKLVNVLRPESLGRLAYRRQGRSRCNATSRYAEATGAWSFPRPTR